MIIGIKERQRKREENQNSFTYEAIAIFAKL
jgi:hypothetical protein